MSWLRCHDVATADVAAVECVMSKLLAHVPVHVLEVGPRDSLTLAIFGDDFDLEGQVVMVKMK